MFGEDVLLDIDTTLDQLIENAQMLQNVSLETLSEEEMDAFQKTQESLVQHLVHLDEHLENKRKQIRQVSQRSACMEIQRKRAQFEKLHSECTPSVEQAKLKKQPAFLSKRRAKRFLSPQTGL